MDPDFHCHSINNRSHSVPIERKHNHSLPNIRISIRLDGEKEKIVEGYLMKKGGTGPIRVWKKRWFFMDNYLLCYSQERFSTGQLCGKIDLSAARSVAPCAYYSITRSLISETEGCFFQIIMPQRIYYLLADDAVIATMWIKELNSIIKQARQRAITADWVLLESAVTLSERKKKQEEMKKSREEEKQHTKSTFPPYWNTEDFDEYQEVLLDPLSEEYLQLSEHMNSTIGDHGHRFGLTISGRDPQGFRVNRIVRVQNKDLWMRYHFVKQMIEKQKKDIPLEDREGYKYLQEKPISAPRLDPKGNEYHLYHGTKREVIDIVKKKGFDERVGSITGMFGAENSSKSNQYIPCPACGQGAIYTEEVCKCDIPQEFAMLVCRVVLGEFHVALKYDSKRYKGTDPRCPVRRPPLKSQDGFELFDSILGESKQFGGDALNYREFVVYDRYQIYPEYMIFYERLDCSPTPGGPYV